MNKGHNTNVGYQRRSLLVNIFHSWMWLRSEKGCCSEKFYWFLLWMIQLLFSKFGCFVDELILASAFFNLYIHMIAFASLCARINFFMQRHVFLSLASQRRHFCAPRESKDSEAFQRRRGTVPGDHQLNAAQDRGGSMGLAVVGLSLAQGALKQTTLLAVSASAVAANGIVFVTLTYQREG